jgi:hypothetical protein
MSLPWRRAFVSSDELAQLLDVRPESATRLLRVAGLPGTIRTASQRWFIPVSQLEALMDVYEATFESLDEEWW